MELKNSLTKYVVQIMDLVHSVIYHRNVGENAKRNGFISIV